MALHTDVGTHGRTIDIRFWPIPIPTPRAMDESMTSGWRRASTLVHCLHLSWLIRKRVLATRCNCCTPEDYNP